jgi:hypothetical protein
VRQAAGLEYPTEHELRLVTEQYLARASYHVGGLPYFHTFLDGSDGWYHLYWTSSAPQGYSPPRWCDSRRPDRECLTIGALFGWGLLASHDARLRDFANQFIDLAASTDASALEFRRRYLTFSGQEFVLGGSARPQQGSLLLFDVIAESLPSSHTRW